MKTVRQRLIIGALVLLLAKASVFVSGETPGPDEMQVRAAMLVNLLRFVTWQHPKSGDPHAPLVVGLLGASEQSNIIERYLANHSLDGRAFLVRRMGKADRCDDCQVLFVSSAERKRFDELSNALMANDVLTVSDDGTFAYSGGIVGLPLVGDKIEIQVNLIAAEHSNLTISSRLLNIAKIIRKERGK